MVDGLAPYSGRRRDEPRWRRRLVHALDQQPDLARAVHVSRQRSVHERQDRPRGDLLERCRRRGCRDRRASTAPPGSGRRSSRCPASAATGGSGGGGSGRRVRAPGRSRRCTARSGRCARTRGTSPPRRTRRCGTAGRRRRPGRRSGRPPRSLATDDLRAGRVDADHVGAERRRPAARPGPRRTRRRAPARHPRGARSTSGRICSSYSGSAPSVNSRCHQPACVSQSDGSLTIHRTSSLTSPRHAQGRRAGGTVEARPLRLRREPRSLRTRWTTLPSTTEGTSTWSSCRSWSSRRRSSTRSTRCSGSTGPSEAAGAPIAGRGAPVRRPRSAGHLRRGRPLLVLRSRDGELEPPRHRRNGIARIADLCDAPSPIPQPRPPHPRDLTLNRSRGHRGHAPSEAQERRPRGRRRPRSPKSD